MDKESEDKIERGECAAQRFWGQTCIHIPIKIFDRVGKSTLEKIAREVYIEQLREEDIEIYGGPTKFNYYTLELPSVLIFPGKEQSRWNIPDILISRIMETYNKHLS